MLLSEIQVKPNRQFRDRPFSEKTVAGILAEGFNAAKFDPIPVTIDAAGAAVGGDGHSRLEAVRRLAAAGQLPAAWKVGDDWDIPVRTISSNQAKRVARSQNFSRDNFTPAEQARAFQSYIDDGYTVEKIAAETHTGVVEVRRMLAINTLAADILAAVGTSPAAGGIDVLTAHVLATGFERYGITQAQQFDLWHQCLKNAMLNFQSAKKFVDQLGAKLGAKSSADLLFTLPANVANVLQSARETAGGARKAKMGISMLAAAVKVGALADFPELAEWITIHGDAAIEKLDSLLTIDGEILAKCVA